MIAPPERTAERDAALDALLPRVPRQGWTMAALRGALADLGGDRLDAELLFPGGAADMVEAFIDLADRRMVEAAGDLSALRTPGRVRALLAARFRLGREHREAIRHAAGVLALPRHAGLAARCTARTVDTIWHAAGDVSADFSWYTKRATLAAVYSATLLFWLRDAGEDDSATLAFLDRRLSGVARIGAMRARVRSGCARLLPRRLRPQAAA
jgi:ubiquinone biosynthesis protein COQ9